MDISELIINTEVDKISGLGSLEVTVHADTGDKDLVRIEMEKHFLWAQLLDEDGMEVDRIFPLEVEEEVQFCMQAEAVRLWDGEKPYLYHLNLELRDEENRLLGCVEKKIAFRIWEIKNDVLFLNEKAVRIHLEKDTELFCEPQMSYDWERAVKEKLSDMKKRRRNALYLPKEYRTPVLQELCLSFGIYLLNEEKYRAAGGLAEAEETEEDFTLEVIEQGVLIENHSQYINASEYDLYYELFDGEKILQRSVMEADVPAGTGRYLELPFIKPQNPGEYSYRVSLRLRKEEPWGKKGDVVAMGETRVSNLWMM